MTHDTHPVQQVTGGVRGFIWDFKFSLSLLVGTAILLSVVSVDMQYAIVGGMLGALALNCLKLCGRLAGHIANRIDSIK